MRKEIEERLVKFAADTLGYTTEHLSQDLASCYLAEQLTRSSLSAALNFGDAQGAESKKDFVYKTSLVLKELRESNINLKLIKAARLSNNAYRTDVLLDESDQLVSIFHKAIVTAKRNLKKEKLTTD